MSTLKINSSARTHGSISRLLTQYLADNLNTPVIDRDLSLNTFPVFSAEDLMDMHHSRDIPRQSLIEHQKISTELITELKSAQILILGVPIYNFSISASLKRWIDYIVRSGITFRYGDNGPEGLSDIKTAFVITSSGGTDIGGPNDFASTYIEHICKFIGAKEINHIHACGSKGSAEKILSSGKDQINTLLEIN